MKLTSVTLESALSDTQAQRIDKQAFLTFFCSGKQDYSLAEEEVDKILGREAFCGGELSERHFELLEKAVDGRQGFTYFWPASDRENAKSFIKMLDVEGIGYRVNDFEETDWNSKWRDAFSEIIVNDFCRIIPAWHKQSKSDHYLFIYPGMGFGTGNHETTFLCLVLYYLIRSELAQGVKCLDFGCGSGILGIAPMKDKNADVCFVDIDTAALDNCVMNLELNDHSDYCGHKEVVLRDRFQGGSYDLIFANILEHVLIEEQRVILNSLNVGGFLVISGLLNEQVDHIVEAYHCVDLVKVEKRGDWSAVLFKKNR